MLKGIDTSKWQAGLPDATINADFIIFKATEGVGYVDPDCSASYQEAKTAGKLLGVYDFARPDGNSAISEANFFLDNIKGYIGEAIMILDWEHTPTDDVNWAYDWLSHVYQVTGIKPWIYMNRSTANSFDWRRVNDAGFALWVAQYADNIDDFNYDMAAAGPAPEVNWSNGYVCWQWTSNGWLSGYNGDLDCNLFYGDVAAWKSFAVGHPAVEQPTQSTPVEIPIIETKPVEAPVSTPIVETPNIPISTTEPVTEATEQPKGTSVITIVHKTKLALLIEAIVEFIKKFFKKG